jgi:hypothetical protein
MSMGVPNFEIIWIDDGREPKNPPDPAYPDGIDLDVTRGRLAYCETALAHPTPRCGKYLIKCRTCGFTTLITTAGRADDPRSIKIPCKLN